MSWAAETLKKIKVNKSKKEASGLCTVLYFVPVLLLFFMASLVCSKASFNLRFLYWCYILGQTTFNVHFCKKKESYLIGCSSHLST